MTYYFNICPKYVSTASCFAGILISYHFNITDFQMSTAKPNQSTKKPTKQPNKIDRGKMGLCWLVFMSDWQGQESFGENYTWENAPIRWACYASLPGISLVTGGGWPIPLCYPWAGFLGCIRSRMNNSQASSSEAISSRHQVPTLSSFPDFFHEGLWSQCC